MNFEIEIFAKTLKMTREGQGLTQRELSKKSGVPQPHISKIESGAVDLRLSSLIAIARVLELEMLLVPRKAVPAVQSVIRSSNSATSPESSAETQKEFRRLQETIKSIQAVAQNPELAQAASQLRELQHIPLSLSQIETLKEVRRVFKAFKEHTNGFDDLRQAISNVQRMRNELSHIVASATRVEPVKPAYSLDEEGSDDA